MLDQQSKTELSGTAEIDQMTAILNVQRIRRTYTIKQ